MNFPESQLTLLIDMSIECKCTTHLLSGHKMQEMRTLPPKMGLVVVMQAVINKMNKMKTVIKLLGNNNLFKFHSLHSVCGCSFTSCLCMSLLFFPLGFHCFSVSA